MHTTGNNLTGDYAATAIGTDTLTTDENITGTGISSTLHDVVSGSSTLTNTGNDFSGAFVTSDKENNTTVLSQSGHNASGTYTLTEDLSDNPTIDKWGDGIDGIQTISQTGEQVYNFYETNVSGSATDSLSGFGDNPYTLTGTDNANTGDSTRVQTGTEEYELQETTFSGGTEYFMDNVGFDTYTQSTNSNSQSGVFTQTTTGDGTYSGSGFANGAFYSPLSDSGSTSFSTQEIANTRDGSLALTQTGTTRYSVLKSFNNTSDGANGGSGIADFSPVGLPVMVGRASVPAGVFSSVGDDRYDYCFAAGTLVVMADGTRKGIETIIPGEQVLAAPDSDPTAKPRACRVKAVYHNAPARLVSVNVAGQTIRATANHPFHVEGKGWVEAGNLVRGDRLRTDGGEWVTVERVDGSGQVEAVFNLQVAECHTYFVAGGAAEVAVLVHNESEYRPQAWTDAKQKVAADLHMNTNNWQILQNAYDHNPDFKKAVDAYVPWVEKWYRQQDYLQPPVNPYRVISPEELSKRLGELATFERAYQAQLQHEAYLSQFPSMRASTTSPEVLWAEAQVRDLAKRIDAGEAIQPDACKIALWQLKAAREGTGAAGLFLEAVKENGPALLASYAALKNPGGGGFVGPPEGRNPNATVPLPESGALAAEGVVAAEGTAVIAAENATATSGLPRTGREIGSGAEGSVYVNADAFGWVVKVFTPGKGSPLQARNEYQNLENARAMHPQNVVQARAPVDPRQGFLVKQEFIPSNTEPNYDQGAQLLRDFQNIHDSSGNLQWGTTADNPTPRWILIE